MRWTGSASTRCVPGFYDYEGGLTDPRRGEFLRSIPTGQYPASFFFITGKSLNPMRCCLFRENYRIGDVYSMIVFGLNVEEFEYAYRVDGAL